MENYHAAYWSSDPFRLSSSEEEEETHYRITHHNRTKRRGKGQRRQQQQQQQQRPASEQNLDYTTWEEIDRWAVDPGRVPEPAWDSMEQCKEGYRRMRLAKPARQCDRYERQPPQKKFGAASRTCRTAVLAPHIAADQLSLPPALLWGCDFPQPTSFSCNLPCIAPSNPRRAPALSLGRPPTYLSPPKLCSPDSALMLAAVVVAAAAVVAVLYHAAWSDCGG